MESSIVITEDGSPTLYHPVFEQNYHSIHGAVSESQHVFIQNGLDYWLHHNKDKTCIDILEMGFGSGLNAILTAKRAVDLKLKTIYTTYESFPISIDKAIEISTYFENSEMLINLHQCPWEQAIEINNYFTIIKKEKKMELIDEANKYDLLFYDAFSPTSQPELWTTEIFQKLFKATKNQGLLSTYCAKGSVKRALKEAGWQITGLKGPKGKREMTIAEKK
jgi:tRNA U34 5-methylaminomethyl-2-thiouridine-forming methyltransferase MnmC